MERKKTQRIIGILVIIAIVVIILPLLFGKSDIPMQTKKMPAPPLPAQQNQSVAQATQNQAPAKLLSVPAEPAQPDTSKPTVHPVNTVVQASPVKAEQETNTNNMPPIPTVVITPKEAKQINEVGLADEAVEGVTTDSFDIKTMNDGDMSLSADASKQNAEKNTASEPAKTISTQNTSPAVAVDNKTSTVFLKSVEDKKSLVKPTNQKKSAIETKPVKSIVASKKSEERVMGKLKSPAWVVQMGSFKVRANALHLADKLKGAGFKTFTREIKSSTRVYIGPEFKQASAANLSHQVQQKLNMHGIVMSYKPLEL